MNCKPLFLLVVAGIAMPHQVRSAPPVPVAPPPPANTLRLGAWNIEHLGTRSPSQKPSDLAEYILASRVDVLALEEIHDDDQISGKDPGPGKEPWRSRVLNETLPLLKRATGDDWEYLLTDPKPANVRVQMTGVLWRTGRVTFLNRSRLSVPGGMHQNDKDLTYWTRHPEAFQFRAGNTADKKTDFVVIPLHMKSNSDGEEGAVMRKIEAGQLVTALTSLQATLQGEKDFVLLGDSNIKAPEQDVQKIWKDFRDLNEADANTWFKPGPNPPAPFDRIFVPVKQSEFLKSIQSIHGPYAASGQSKDQWLADHLRLRSDHLLIWCDMAVSPDDD